MKNVVVNVTLPADVVDYIDDKAERLYISRSTVARQLVMEHVEEEKIVDLRKKGFSIRKISEVTGIRYDRVLQMIGRTGVDEEEDPQLEQYMERVQKTLMKKR